MQPNASYAQWAQQQQQPSGYQGQPPAKKARAESNPALNTTVTTNGTVITKYAPPPGYAGPAAPKATYPAQAWPQAVQGHPYGYSAYPGYQQAYGATQPLQYPGYPQYSVPGYAAQAYPPQAYPAGYPGYPGYGHQAAAAYQYPPNTAFTGSPPAETAPSQAWQQPSAWPASVNGHMSQHSQPGSHKSAPSISLPTMHTSHSRDGSVSSVQPAAGVTFIAEAMESQFDDECYWAEHPEEIVPELSLGMIESQSALPTQRPIPATFKEAELEALAPRAQEPQLSGYISEYYTEENRDEQLNTIRYSRLWTEVQDDMIYKDFPSTGFETFTLNEILGKYRDRPDPDFVIPTRIIPRMTSNGHKRPSESVVSEAERRSQPPAKRCTGHAARAQDPLDHLESALRDGSLEPRPISAASSHSRASSVASGYSERLTRPKQLPKIHDPHQDELLRALGVEGSPKVVYETPGPALGPRPSSEQSNREYPNERNHQAYDARHAPPPPPTQRSNSHDNARRENNWTKQRNLDGHRRPDSASSQHTVAGSDFDTGEDMDVTPRPKYNRTDSRKRSYYEVEEPAREDHRGSGIDDTPKQSRYKQARTISDAYRRRWD